jgi:hypothetical protein
VQKTKIEGESLVDSLAKSVVKERVRKKDKAFPGEILVLFPLGRWRKKVYGRKRGSLVTGWKFVTELQVPTTASQSSTRSSFRNGFPLPNRD